MGDGAPGGRSVAARAIDVVLRTCHLGSMAALSGGLAFEVPAAALRPWLVLTFATGGGLLLSEASHGRHWACQGRGLFAMAHVGSLALLSALHLPRAAAATALVVGAVGSHLPRSIRKWSLRHRQVID
jgi:hypothetical protein